MPAPFPVLYISGGTCCILQVCEHEASRKPDFDKENNRNPLHQKGFGKENQQQIQRACTVIGKQAPEIASAAAVPGIKKAAPLLKLVLKLSQEGNILMIHVYYSNLPASEGINSGNGKSQHHNEYRQKECCKGKSIVLNKSFYIISHLCWTPFPHTQVFPSSPDTSFRCILPEVQALQ